MINGTGWLVVTKLDVLDELAEIPVCVGYKVDGKETQEIPAQASGYEKIEPVYAQLPGWNSATYGIDKYDRLPAKAKSYLDFVEKETGAKMGIVSTGPDREQTVFRRAVHQHARHGEGRVGLQIGDAVIVLAVNLGGQSWARNAGRRNLREVERASRQEPGCLMFVVHRHRSDPRLFFVYEQYRDDEALETHRQSAHFQKYAVTALRTSASVFKGSSIAVE